MFRSFVTWIRGAAIEVDSHAFAVLRHQLRECAQAISTAQKAIALAVEQRERELTKLCSLSERVADIEERPVAAPENGRSALASEAAGTMARLQSELEVSRAALVSLQTELDRLRASVAISEGRLRELKRDEKMAAMADKTQSLSGFVPVCMVSALRDAEMILARLRARQTQIDAA